MPENAPTNTAAADEGVTPEHTLHGVVLDAEKDSPRVLFTLKDNPQLERRLGELMDDNLLVEPVRRELFVRLKLLVGKDMVSNTRRGELEKNARALGHILESCAELVLRFKSVTNTRQEKVPVFELMETAPAIDESRMDEALAFVEEQDEQARNPAPLTATVKKSAEPVSQVSAHDTRPISLAKEETHVGELPLGKKPEADPDSYFDPVDKVWINIKDPKVPFAVKKRALAFGKQASNSRDAATEMLRRQLGKR